MKNKQFIPQSKWRLISPAGLYVQAMTLDFVQASLGPVETAEVYDERDNADFKRRFFSAVLHVDIQPEVVSCAC